MNLSKPISLRLCFSLMLGLAALAGDNYTRVPLPTKDVAKTFLVASDPINRDGTFNAVALAPGKVKKGVKAVPLGLVPRSILAKSKGGNDAPIQAYILGVQPAAGAVVKGRPVGLVVRTVAGKDETRVALAAWDGNLGSCRSLDEVEKLAPGTLAALKDGFGAAKDATFATKGRKEALRFLGDAITDFICAYVTDADRRPLDKDGNPLLYKWAGARNIGE
jgi:hypothetical protein